MVSEINKMTLRISRRNRSEEQTAQRQFLCSLAASNTECCTGAQNDLNSPCFILVRQARTLTPESGEEEKSALWSGFRGRKRNCE